MSLLGKILYVPRSYVGCVPASNALCYHLLWLLDSNTKKFPFYRHCYQSQRYPNTLLPNSFYQNRHNNEHSLSDI